MLTNLIMIYIVISLALTIAYMKYADDFDSAFGYYGLVTKYIYENTKMNLVGCFVFAIGYYLFIPILFVPRGIGMFVYWLFHIGRRDKNA